MAYGTRPRIAPLPRRHRSMLKDVLPAERLKGFPTATPARYPSGRIWPHGEFSYGYARPRPDGGEWHENPLYVTDRALDHIREDWALAQFPLDLSVLPNSHSRAKRGLKGITSYGKQSVKAAGFLMKDRFPHHRVTFGTITLPPMPREHRQALTEAWPEAVRQLIQWLGRRLKRQGLPPLVVSVSEIQPKRLTSEGEGYLHLHLMWLNRPGKKGNWAVDPVELSDWFGALCCRLLEVDEVGRINVDVRRVTGDTARYLAKYMSKGGEVLAEALADWGESVCPRQWWNLSGALRALVKENTLSGRLPGEWLEMLVDYVFSTGDDSPVEFLRHVELDLNGVLVTVGWRGRLSDRVRIGVQSGLSAIMGA